jgi:hypothetical protein
MRTAKWILIGALAFVLLWVFCIPRPGSPPADLSTDAKIACQSFVQQRLGAPATASFAPYPSQTAVRQSDGSFSVRGYVDAQNTFGANIRTTYECSVRQSTSGDWTLVSLNTSP